MPSQETNCRQEQSPFLQLALAATDRRGRKSRFGWGEGVMVVGGEKDDACCGILRPTQQKMARNRHRREKGVTLYIFYDPE